MLPAEANTARLVDFLQKGMPDQILLAYLQQEIGKFQLIEQIKQQFDSIRVIVSPPRCASTALARMFWQHPQIRYYSHEPFETSYYEHAPLQASINSISEPIDLSLLYAGKRAVEANGLIIKEMPYQVNDNFPLLAGLTNFPIIFLIRNPLLNIFSRIQKKIEAHTDPIFPLIETGWNLLIKQIAYCKAHNIDFVILESNDFRNYPQEYTQALFSRVGLTYEAEFCEWSTADNIALDNLGGAHSHLYSKVLSSSSVLPAIERVPEISEFPLAGGIREHVIEALEMYQVLSGLPDRLHI